MASIFALIQLLLKLFGLWDQFRNYADTQFKKEIEERRQAREKAIEDLKNAKTEEEFDEAQERIARNSP
jgi:DNA-binding transcriptional regulator GbsR (MarR family)